MFDVALENRTPFEAATHVQMDGKGQEVLVVILSATFVAQEDGNLDLAPEQAPVCFADEPFGEPGRSSIRIEADIAPIKPKVDIVVIGAAYAPMERPSPEVMVRMRVADICKTLKVTGDRALSSMGLGKPAPFIRMPIVYERAFGGTTESAEVYAENPVGIGYRGALSADPMVGSRVPNIEYADPPPRRSGNHALPAGFGIVARNWAPRIALAGTYDQDWVDSVWPLPPSDFNPLFNQVAPQDQQTQSISGGELVELTNLTPSGMWCFRLPRLVVPLRLIFDERTEVRELRIDTVLIDSEKRTVTLKSRLAVTRLRNAPRLREIVMGHVSAAWVTARQKRKAFRDPFGSNGTLPGQATFQL